MKFDLFEFDAQGMTPGNKAWRVIFLLVCIGVAAADLFYWRPL